MSALAGVFRALGRASRALIRGVQRVVMAVSLFLVYFLALGLTKLVATLFQRRLLRWSAAGQDSYWEPALGYDADPEEATHQS